MAALGIIQVCERERNSKLILKGVLHTVAVAKSAQGRVLDELFFPPSLLQKNMLTFHFNIWVQGRCVPESGLASAVASEQEDGCWTDSHGRI